MDYKTDLLIHVHTEDEAITLIKKKISVKYPLFILGGGSNLLFTGDYKGTLLHSEIDGISIDEKHRDYHIVSCGSGLDWDFFVEWSVNNGYGGLENLSLIPGQVGASPVQNIGAYGVEIKDVIEKVRAVSLEDGSVREFTRNECCFEYRNSVFKNELKGKYLITRVYYKLATNPILKYDYGSLAVEIKKLGEINLRNVRDAVINIRQTKLADPKITGNAGSFFKNPVVSRSAASALKKRFPEMPYYEDPSGAAKLAAGWLIDQAGWKGKRIGDAGVHDKQALVLINFGNATGDDILKLADAINRSVRTKFGIELEREVEVVESI